jgi:hypothetical protein
MAVRENQPVKIILQLTEGSGRNIKFRRPMPPLNANWRTEVRQQFTSNQATV